jgi:hypothetical protein
MVVARFASGLARIRLTISLAGAKEEETGLLDPLVGAAAVVSTTRGAPAEERGCGCGMGICGIGCGT